jgi:hypothetical protein
MLRGSIFFILGKRDDVRDAEGGTQKIISVKLNLVRKEMKFEMMLLFGFEKRSIYLTFLNTKYLVISFICHTFAV